MTTTQVYTYRDAQQNLQAARTMLGQLLKHPLPDYEPADIVAVDEAAAALVKALRPALAGRRVVTAYVGASTTRSGPA